jgi:lambda family phage portal protein
VRAFLAPIRHSVARFAVRSALRVLGFYEGAVRFSPDRGNLPGWVQDDRFDADASSRSELLRKARYFEANSALVNRLADVFEQYTVGPRGLRFTPSSSSEEWNKAITARWDQWCQFADLSSRQSLSQLQSLAAYRWFIDGEVFILKTRGGAPDYWPRVQVIESHRVSTPWELAGQEGDRIHDGVEVDRNGRPIAYHVRTTWDGDASRRIPASQIIHVFEPSRPGQLRGRPFITPVITDLNDLEDLQKLEMRAAKLVAELALVLKTRNGDVGSLLDIRKKALEVDGKTGGGANTIEQRQKDVHKVTGGRVIALYKDEEAQALTSGRPSVVTQAYWDSLVAKVCVGVGITKALVYPASVQGTVARADLDVATAFFRSRSSVLQSAFAQVFEYVIGDEITYGTGLPKPPDDWRKVSVRPPRSPNVDVGRNSKAMLDELKAGTRTLEDIWAECGEDWRERDEQLEREENRALERAARVLKRAKELAAESDCEPDELLRLAGLSDDPPQPEPVEPVAPKNEEKTLTE